MKFIVLSALCLSSLYAQTAPQPKAPALPDLPDDASVASCPDGNLITMGQLRGLLVAVNNSQAAANIQGFLDQWCMVRKMAQLAEDQKLDKESPIKEELLYAQKFTLAQAEIQHAANPIVPMSDEESYYNEHKSNYEQVKTYAIFIAFSNATGAQSDAGGKKILSKTEAKAKADGLLAQIRKGADFKKLAKENSDDEVSRAKDGFFSDLKPTDPLPEVFKGAIFKLKPGETTEVLGQENGNGFYIFRAEGVVFKPYSEVQDQVDRAYKEDQFKQWMGKLQSETKATILNPKLTGK